MTTLRIASQNMTEGPVTPDLRAADIVIGQEIRRWRIRTGMPLKRHWFPGQDPHQSISWRPGKYHVTAKGYDRFHRSGQAEGWPFRSPARGLVWTEGTIGGVPVAVAGLWFLNSWGKANAEGPARKKIVEELTLPVVDAALQRWQMQDRLIILTGDANNIRWDGHFSDLREVKPNGLDRAWISNDPRITASNLRDGATTGVGRDLRHKAVLFDVTVGAR